MDDCLKKLSKIQNELRQEYELCLLNDGNMSFIVSFIEKKKRQIQDLIDIKEYLKSLPCVNGYALLRQNILNDDDILLGWHSNIACWIMDNLCIVDYDTRNKLAQKFIKRFFDIDYDWVKLVNPDNRTYSIDEKLMKGEKSHESK